MLPLEPYTTTVGPFTRVGTNGVKYRIYSEKRVGYKQAFPYDLVTAYSLTIFKVYFGNTDADSWSWSASETTSAVDAENLARKRFVSKMGDASQWGSTLTSERVKTFSSLVDIVTRAGLAARQIRRMEFLMAANTLGLPYNETRIKRSIQRKVYVSRKNGLGRRLVRKRHYTYQTRFSFGTGRDYAKNSANGWLMYSYGVKPLMDDIYNSADILQRPLEERRVKSSGYAGSSLRLDMSEAWLTRSWNVKVNCSAYVRVSNPNLWLANQLGLVNTVQMVNEGIPFSFVVDWFSNLSQMIQQMTDFVGIEVISPCKTTIAYGKEAFLYKPPHDKYNVSWSKEHTYVTRSLSLPVAKLRFSPERFELQRGLNAISLLVGFLPRKR